MEGSASQLDQDEEESVVVSASYSDSRSPEAAEGSEMTAEQKAPIHLQIVPSVLESETVRS